MMMMHLQCVLLFLVVVHCNNDVQFFVDPIKGNDLLFGSKEAPFRSISRAKEAVRKVNQNMKGEIFVNLREGVYSLAETIEFSKEDSGFNGQSISYRSFPKEKVILSGGVSVGPWSLIDSTKKIWSAALPTQLKGKTTRQLYANGMRAQRTSIPFNSIYTVSGNVVQTTAGYLVNTTYPLDKWLNQNYLEMVYTGNGASWTEVRIGVDHINRLDNNRYEIVMKQPGFWVGVNKQYDQGVSMPIYVENSYEFLNMAGQWYHDVKGERILYIPRSGEVPNTNLEVIVPVLDHLLTGYSSNSLSFINIQLMHTTWLRPSYEDAYVDTQASFCIIGIHNTTYNDDDSTWIKTPAAVEFHASNNITFSNCTFIHLGSAGINFDYGSQNNMITGCEFTDISSSGVQIGDINDFDQKNVLFQTFGNSVINNYLHDMPVEYHGSVGIWGGYTTHTTISHNTLRNMAYSGISLGWGWDRRPTTYMSSNLIANNLVDNLMLVLVDGGAIYTLGDQPNSFVLGNYVRHQKANFGAIYHDQGSGHFVSASNVIEGAPYWVFIWNSNIHDIIVKDCFSDTTTMNNQGTNCTVTQTTYVTNGVWPATAKQIMANAGAK